MKWYQYVEYMIRCYMLRHTTQQELQRELLGLEDNINIRTSSFSHTKQFSTFKSSSQVEREVENREASRENIFDRLQRLNRRVEKVEHALSILPGKHLEVIEWAYMKMELNTDEEIAYHLEMHVKEFRTIKNEALHMIYDNLKFKPKRDQVDIIAINGHRHIIFPPELASL